MNESKPTQPLPKLPKGGSAITDMTDKAAQAQADRRFLMMAWLDLSKQAAGHLLPSTSLSSDTLSILPSKVIDEMKEKIKAGFFDV